MSDSSDDDDLPDLESVDSSEVRENEHDRIVYRGSTCSIFLDIVLRFVTWLVLSDIWLLKASLVMICKFICTPTIVSVCIVSVYLMRPRAIILSPCKKIHF